MIFNYNLPVNIIFGRGKIELVGEECAKYGRKALIVTGHSSTKKSGLLDKTIALLEKSGVNSVVFDKVSQNPLTTTVYEGVDVVKANNCDVIVGLGGGSIMDCAKAIAFMSVNDGDVSDYIFGIRQSDKALNLILVPTTCGTGSEGNGFAVLTNPDNGDKKSLRCNSIIAKASIVDSSLMETMPSGILASVGFDALCHCMEAYMANSAQPFTTALAIEGMKLMAAHLPIVYEGKGNTDDWDAVTLASTIGGMVIGQAGVTISHGMEHPASGLKDIVHGRGLAALTPVVTRHTIAKAPEKFNVISQCLGGKDASDCVDKIYELLDKINLRVTLSDQGITADDVDWMVDNMFKVSIGNYNNHPCKFEKEEIRQIYIEAL